MTTAAVFGCTGAVGSQILATLLASDAFPFVKTISRRLPSAQSPKLEAIEEADTSKWGPAIAALSPLPGTVFNAVGTTRAAAGGIQNQWKIDHDLCIANAKAAKEAGVKTYVFISSMGTRSFMAGYFPYTKMKIGVEDAIMELGFENAIIVRPGAIMGREEAKAPVFEAVIAGLGKLSQGLQDKMGTLRTSLDSVLDCSWAVGTNGLQARIKQSLGGRPWRPRAWLTRGRRRPRSGVWSRLILSGSGGTSGRSNALLTRRLDASPLGTRATYVIYSQHHTLGGGTKYL